MAQPVINIPQPIGTVSDKYNQQPNSAGLDMNYLIQIDTLMIHQVKTGSNKDKRFVVKNERGEQLFSFIKSEQYLGRSTFEAILFNNSDQEVLRIFKKRTGCCCVSCCYCCAHCCNGCCNTCLIQTEIQAPVGSTIGYMRQSSTCCTGRVELLDENLDEKLIDIDSHCCVCYSGGYQNDDEFPMAFKNGSSAGSFFRKYKVEPGTNTKTYPQHFMLTFNPSATLRDRQLMFGAFLQLYCVALAYNIPQARRRR